MFTTATSKSRPTHRMHISYVRRTCFGDQLLKISCPECGATAAAIGDLNIACNMAASHVKRCRRLGHLTKEAAA